jgi:hypothetical protein
VEKGLHEQRPRELGQNFRGDASGDKYSTGGQNFERDVAGFGTVDGNPKVERLFRQRCFAGDGGSRDGGSGITGGDFVPQP